jgi:ABC-2 type transport system ATP-binding protein
MIIDTSLGAGTSDEGFVVETFGLTKRFGERTAVDGVDLHIPRGVAFGYLGPNGAGKTTLIRMLLGLTPATAGTMRILGREVPADRAEALARVGAIVEEPHFHGYLTGRENLAIVAAAREREAHQRIGSALKRTGLADRADEKVKSYSLGMRQRLGVARSLLGDPELLLLDEPTNGLDPAGILEFRGMVRWSMRAVPLCCPRTCSARWRRSAIGWLSSITAGWSRRARSRRSRPSPRSES